MWFSIKSSVAGTHKSRALQSHMFVFSFWGWTMSALHAQLLSPTFPAALEHIRMCGSVRGSLTHTHTHIDTDTHTHTHTH